MANKKLSKTGGNAGYQITRAHAQTMADLAGVDVVCFKHVLLM